MRQPTCAVPGQRLGLGRPLWPDPWQLTDTLPTASLIGSISGQGGGNQLSGAQILQGFRHRFGPAASTTLWGGWRERNDSGAPTTVTTGRRFPYELPPSRPAAGACFDAISPIGLTTAPLMPWVNRPTHQQAVEIAGHRPR